MLFPGNVISLPQLPQMGTSANQKHVAGKTATVQFKECQVSQGNTV
jgi:hypothetical protein